VDDVKTGPPPLPASLQTTKAAAPTSASIDPQGTMPGLPVTTRIRDPPTMRAKRAGHRAAKAAAKASLCIDDSDAEFQMALLTDSSSDDDTSDYRPSPRPAVSAYAPTYPSPNSFTRAHVPAATTDSISNPIRPTAHDDIFPPGFHGPAPSNIKLETRASIKQHAERAIAVLGSPAPKKRTMVIPGTLLTMDTDFFCIPCKAKGLQNALFQTEARTSKHIISAAHHKNATEALASGAPMLPEYRDVLVMTLSARAQADDSSSLAARMMAQWELNERRGDDVRAPSASSLTNLSAPPAVVTELPVHSETYPTQHTPNLRSECAAPNSKPHSARYLAYLLATSTARDSGTSEEEVVLKQWTDELWIRYHEGTLHVADHLPGMCTLCNCEMKHEGNVKTHGKGKKHRGNCKKLLQDALHADEDSANSSSSSSSSSMTDSPLSSGSNSASLGQPTPAGRGRGRGSAIKRGRSPTRSTERPTQKQKTEVTLGFDCYKCKERITVPKNGKRSVYCANCGSSNDVPRF